MWRGAFDPEAAKALGPGRPSLTRGVESYGILLGTAQTEVGSTAEAGSAFRRATRIYALLGDADAVAESARKLKDVGIETLLTRGG